MACAYSKIWVLTKCDEKNFWFSDKKSGISKTLLDYEDFIFTWITIYGLKNCRDGMPWITFIDLRTCDMRAEKPGTAEWSALGLSCLTSQNLIPPSMSSAAPSVLPKKSTAMPGHADGDVPYLSHRVTCQIKGLPKPKVKFWSPTKKRF